MEDVPWVMYFTDEGHALHGTYWHQNFGYPMSHGCVNLPLDVAEWMFGWTPEGTGDTIIPWRSVARRSRLPNRPLRRRCRSRPSGAETSCVGYAYRATRGGTIHCDATEPRSREGYRPCVQRGVGATGRGSIAPNASISIPEAWAEYPPCARSASRIASTTACSIAPR